MVKYTQLFSEWIEDGGTLPSILGDLEGLEEALIYKYFDCEIGYETPLLFGMKLEGRANEVVPIYVQKQIQLEVAFAALSTPSSRVHTRTYQAGGRSGESYDRPISGSSTPTEKTSTASYTDTDTTRETGTTPDETMKIAQARLDYQIQSAEILRDCVNEFSNLFMGVY